MLNIPPSQRLLDVLSGPGLNAPLVTAETAGRIRAGVAHPVIAAGIAAVLVTGVQALALASTPWDALSPENDTLQLTWHPPNRQLVPASLAASPAPATSAVFHVPAAARPLLQAARHFSRSAPGHRAAGRLFAATPFSNERIGAAAANCKVPLPAQPSLTAMWQISAKFGARAERQPHPARAGPRRCVCLRTVRLDRGQHGVHHRSGHWQPGVSETSRFRCALSGSRGGRRCGGSGGRG
jgi:hypothetical protein